MMNHTEEWMERGACRTTNSDAFFPDTVGQANRAVRTCLKQCPVLDQCRSYALHTRQPYGVWGGLTEKQLTRILREHDGKPATKTRRSRQAPRRILQDLDDVERAEILDRVDSAEPMSAVAADVGTSPDTVRRLWNKYRTGTPPGSTSTGARLP